MAVFTLSALRLVRTAEVETDREDDRLRSDRGDQEDDVWADAVRGSDRGAFECLFRKYYDPLCTFALGYVGRRDAVEEMVQDLFLHIWDRRAEWEPKGTVRAYLYTAVRNKAFNHLKRAQFSVALDQEPDVFCHPPADGPDLALYSKQLTVLATKAIGELPERRRLIFLLSRRHEMTYAEIADMLNISVKTVETQMSRALQHLRDRLLPLVR